MCITNQPPSPAAKAGRQAPGSIALDQWRGLALILVLISHGFFLTGRVHGIGRVGVNLFFFISGILVFQSLSRDKSRTGTGLITSFWRKRLRRLYPALLAYVGVMAGAMVWLQHIPNLPPESDLRSFLGAAPYAVIYLINYVHPPASLGHLWSLACEMQFYLLAPLIFLAGGRGRAWSVFVIALAVLIGLGAAYPILHRGEYTESKYHFEFAVWPMMLGFCCKYLERWFMRLPLLLVKWSIRASVIVFAAAFCLMAIGMQLKTVVIATGILLIGPCLLAYLYGRPMPGPAGRFLAWVGERTYSIYLWQQPLSICGFLPTALHPIGALVAIPMGALWFHWFERPFLSSGPKQADKNKQVGLSCTPVAK